jgi:hypothetical protein
LYQGYERGSLPNQRQDKYWSTYIYFCTRATKDGKIVKPAVPPDTYCSTRHKGSGKNLLHPSSAGGDYFNQKAELKPVSYLLIPTVTPATKEAG